MTLDPDPCTASTHVLPVGPEIGAERFLPGGGVLLSTSLTLPQSSYLIGELAMSHGLDLGLRVLVQDDNRGIELSAELTHCEREQGLEGRSLQVRPSDLKCLIELALGEVGQCSLLGVSCRTEVTAMCPLQVPVITTVDFFVCTHVLVLRLMLKGVESCAPTLRGTPGYRIYRETLSQSTTNNACLHETNV
ncbi:hypothetical protein C5D44_00190 [Rathayibacter sp. AY1B5]|nr:hypothetical protein C5D44_00190 [Rathayibacter sp. AY1B5]